MILNNIVFLLHFLVLAVLSLPQNFFRLPDLKDVPLPQEINSFDDGLKIQSRSINSGLNDSEIDSTEETVVEVERLLKENPNLPRLTRGEILDILENITKQDYMKFLKSSGKNSMRNSKALMVVKAYTPLDGEQSSMEDLYTKPPVTEIIEDVSIKTQKPTIRYKSTTTTSSTTEDPISVKNEELQIDVEPLSYGKKTHLIKKPSNNDEKKSLQFKTISPTSSTTKIIRKFSTTTTTAASIIPTHQRRDFNKRRRRPSSTTSTTTTTAIPGISATTYRPRSRQPPSVENNRYPNHKYPEDAYLKRPYPAIYPPPGIRIYPSPVKTQIQENEDLDDLLPSEMRHQNYGSNTGSRKTPANSASSEPWVDLADNKNIPDNFKSPGQSKSDKLDVENLKNILESLGNLGIYPDLSKKRTTTTSTSTTYRPDASAIADSLTPDMKALLKNFGLLPDPNEIPKNNEVLGFNPEKANIDPKSFAGFKPLPVNRESRTEMQELLSKFGLLENDRDRKSIVNKIVPTESNNSNKNITFQDISMDAIPEELRPIFKDMGLDVRAGRKVREQPHVKTVGKVSTENGLKLETSSEKQHIFNPSPIQSVSEDELKKLGRLLEIMKKLEQLNGTLTEENISQYDKKELKELLISLKEKHDKELVAPLSHASAPNPVELETGLKKNETKREEDEKMEMVELAITERQTPSVKDLEESFGGSTETATESLPETTTPLRSGFYYLLDWNSFFEIDDQKGKRVNLRFQPKVGDPKRFFNVKIP